MRTLTSAGADAAVRAAFDAGQAIGVPVTVALVDAGGDLKALHRMDGAPLVSIQTAISKAYATAAVGMPCDEFFEAIKEDAAAVAAFASRPGMALIAGGLPVTAADGSIIGGIGVAGAMTGAQDREIAEQARVACAAQN